MNPAEYAEISVLLVDDDARLLGLYAEVLATSRTVRFVISMAQTVAEAIGKIEAGQIEVILLDLSLPDSSGYETFRRVYDACSDIPIVVLSGLDDEMLATRMVHEGAQDYMLKGEVQISTLARTLRYAIERKNARKALQAERNLLLNVINSVPDAIFVKDTQNRYVIGNRAHAMFLEAASAEAVVGRTIYSFVPFKQAEQITEDDQLVMKTGQVVLNRLENDGPRWRTLTKVPLRDEQGATIGLVGVGRDVTEQKQIEEVLKESKQRLRALAASLQSDREEFRKRTSRELHDEIGQLLTVLRMDLIRLAKNPPQDPEFLGLQARSMAELVDRCIGSVRSICAELRPRVLDDLGLIAALEWQMKEFHRRTEIGCEFSAPATLELDGDLSTVLFRVTQEALTNVVRHAGASRVELTLRVFDIGIELELHDDGRGITPHEIERSRSLGLLGMRERVECVGGTFDISGTPGCGTTVRVRLPSQKT